MPPVIVSITGLPGSGKTYLCHQLQKLKSLGVICLDTDDLAKAKISFQTAEAKHKHRTVIVFAGMTMKIPRAKHRFMIKIDPAVSYKRLFAREYNSLFKNMVSITKAIENNKNPKTLKGDTIRAGEIGWFMPDYADFLKEYKKTMAREKKRGSRIASADSILEAINKIARKLV